MEGSGPRTSLILGCSPGYAPRSCYPCPPHVSRECHQASNSPPCGCKADYHPVRRQGVKVRGQAAVPGHSRRPLECPALWKRHRFPY